MGEQTLTLFKGGLILTERGRRSARGVRRFRKTNDMTENGVPRVLCWLFQALEV